MRSHIQFRLKHPLAALALFLVASAAGFAQSGQQCDPAGSSGGCCTEQGTYAPAGSPCNDGNPHTVDSCNATGVCVGSYPAVMCTAPAVYDPTSGACSAPGSTPACGDGHVDSSEQCDNGSQCANGTDCTGNPGVCGDGSCKPRGGDCCTASCTFASQGTACDDHNACTPTDTCDGSGVCVGSGQVNCDGSDACHPTNFCSPATGSCNTCADPNNTQDHSYCSLESGKCVQQTAACSPYLADSSGTVNKCIINSGTDPKTGDCTYTPKICAPDNCNVYTCQPSTGDCVLSSTTCDITPCVTTDCPNTNACVGYGCSDPQDPCVALVAADCGVPLQYDQCAGSEVNPATSQVCNPTSGCNYNRVNCELPSNPCQELDRNNQVAGCCTYTARNCAAEFGNDPKYTYTCDPTPGTGGCRALLPQNITFGPIASQTQGSTVALTATASSGLTVTFTSLTTSVCTVSGSAATLLQPGTCIIQATQHGNQTYAAAAPVNQSFAVASLATFTITPSPSAETIKRGVLAAFALRIQPVNNFAGNVTLSCTSAAKGSYCANLPQTVKVKQTAYAYSGVLFPATTTPGTYVVTFTGMSANTKAQATATFTVTK